MSRFTSHTYEHDLFKDIYCKLELLENIEEEIGIDLIKAVELCKQVNNKKIVYTKDRYGIYTIKIIYELYKLGFTRATVAKIFNINSSSLEAIEKGISYRELGINFKELKLTKYKDLPNIVLPSYIRDYFNDNTVLNTLIAQGKVSV